MKRPLEQSEWMKDPYPRQSYSIRKDFYPASPVLGRGCVSRAYGEFARMNE